MADDYQSALMRRLGIIGSMGEQANQLAAMPQQQLQQSNIGNSQPPVAGPSQDGNTFASFVNAIRSKESGSNYGARNGDSGALGAYQIMPGNIPQWSQEALGQSISANQFLGSRQLQDQIAQFKLKQYYNQYGPGGAAVAWYAGPGNANKYVSANGKGFTTPQGAYPSISSYALSILRAMGLG
jgi:hypothetical protein